MPEKILLNDNTELEVAWCDAADGVLWANGLHLTFMEAVTIFSDLAKTSKIVGSMDIVFEGYTNLIHISLYKGLVKVALRKEA